MLERRGSHCVWWLRERTFPPLILVPGQSPSHEVKCLTVGKADKLIPTSLTIFIAVLVSIPSMRVRSTPATA